MKIIVLLGGISSEREVSLSSGKGVIEALKALNHEVIPFDPAFGLDGYLSTEKKLIQMDPSMFIQALNHPCFKSCDLVFNCLHGQWGEDGFIQHLLEAYNIKYTGSNSLTSAICMNKHLTKVIWQQHNIPVAEGFEITNQDDLEKTYNLSISLGPKIVIKPNDQGSSVGLYVVENPSFEEFKNKIEKSFNYSKSLIIERFIEGRELTIGILNNQALPIIEIVAKSGVYDYEHKYTSGFTSYLCPDDLDEDLKKKIQNHALKAHQILNAKGCSRLDVRLSKNNDYYFLEINTLPGMTPTSNLPKAAKLIGINYTELCKQIIEDALNS